MEGSKIHIDFARLKWYRWAISQDTNRFRPFPLCAMTLRLINRANDQIPIELDGLTPALLAGMSVDSIRRLPVRRGNREPALGELFQVKGDPADEEWILA